MSVRKYFNFVSTLIITRIIRSVEAGLYDKWKMYSLTINGYVGIFDEPTKVPVCQFDTINMKQAIDEFYILAIGLSITLITCLCENIFGLFSGYLRVKSTVRQHRVPLLSPTLEL